MKASQLKEAMTLIEILENIKNLREHVKDEKVSILTTIHGKFLVIICETEVIEAIDKTEIAIWETLKSMDVDVEKQP